MNVCGGHVSCYVKKGIIHVNEAQIGGFYMNVYIREIALSVILQSVLK